MIAIAIPGHEKDVPNYIHALTLTGLCPVVVTESPDEAADRFGGLLLPGGADIEPSLFQEEKKGSRTIDYPLDLLQLEWMAYFVQKKRPILGICKGIQIINVYFGGTITQDIRTNYLHQYDAVTGDQYHLTSIAAGSFLHTLYGSEAITNSSHHQAIRTLADGLSAIQYSSTDHIIEGITHDHLPIYGVQWHPERIGFEHRKKGIADGGKLFDFYRSCLTAI